MLRVLIGGEERLDATLLSAFDGMRRAVGGEAFIPVHREIAGLAVGVVVDNAYGVAFHSTVFGRLGVDDAEIDATRAGNEPTDPTHAAIYAFARAVAVNRGAIERAGLLQLVAECVFAELVGIVDHLAGRVALDAFLLPRAWNT